MALHSIRHKEKERLFAVKTANGTVFLLSSSVRVALSVIQLVYFICLCLAEEQVFFVCRARMPHDGFEGDPDVGDCCDRQTNSVR